MTDETLERALTEWEFLRHLTDHGFDPYILVGRDLTIRYASPPVSRLVGWQPHQVIGRSVAELLTPESLEFAANGLAEVDQIAREDQWLPTPVQVSVQTASGTVREVDVVARPVGHDAFGGYIVQLHPANAAQRYGAVTRAILDGHSEAEILPMLPPLVEYDLPGTRVAIGLGWTGTGFDHVVGDDELLDLTKPPADDRAALDGLVHSRGEARALTASLSPATLARADAIGFRACWGAPLVAADPDRGGSALVIWHWSVIEPGAIMRTRVTRLIDLARLVLDWADQQRRLAWDVSHDQLTDLLNRGEFMERLEASAGHGRAVLFCDLDDFKPVNDRFGHRVGDVILQVVAERLRSVCGAHAVARLSGDEFAVLIDDVDDERPVIEVAEAIRDALAEPIDLTGYTATIGVSIGVASDLAGAASADLVVDEADRMLRDCKRQGKNTVRSITLRDRR